MPKQVKITRHQTSTAVLIVAKARGKELLRLHSSETSP